MYQSQAKVMVRPNSKPIYLGLGKMLYRGDSLSVLFDKWFQEVGSIRRVINADEFLERVCARLDNGDTPQTLRGVIQAFPLSVDRSMGQTLLEASLDSSVEDVYADAETDQDMLVYALKNRARVVSFSGIGSTPIESKARTEAVVEEFLDEARRLLAGTKVEKRRALESLLEDLRSRQKARAQALVNLYKDARFTRGRLSLAQIEIDRLRRVRGRLRENLESLRFLRRSPIPFSSHELETRARELQFELAGLTELYLPDSERVRRTKKLLESVADLADRSVKYSRDSYVASQKRRFDAKKKELADLESILRPLVDAFPGERERYKIASLEREVLSLDRQVVDTEVDLFNAKLDERRALEQGSLVVLLEPQEGVRVKRRRFTFRMKRVDKGFIPGVFLFSLLATFVFLTIWEFLFLGNRFLDGVESNLDIPVLGVFPPRSLATSRKWDAWKAKVKRDG